jgi:hypothetical protein
MINHIFPKNEEQYITYYLGNKIYDETFNFKHKLNVNCFIDKTNMILLFVNDIDMSMLTTDNRHFYVNNQIHLVEFNIDMLETIEISQPINSILYNDITNYNKDIKTTDYVKYNKDIIALKNLIKENICNAKYTVTDGNCIATFDTSECINLFYSLTKKLPRFIHDFVVYRGMWYSDCFNMHDYVIRRKTELNFYGTISTTFNFDFVTEWIKEDVYFSCIFQINVSSTNNYFVIHDGTSNANQYEITLAPGKLIIIDCKKTVNNNIIFVANYVPFTVEHIMDVYEQKSIMIGGNYYYHKYLKYKKKYLLEKSLLNNVQHF